jgi:hypothetical protein
MKLLTYQTDSGPPGRPSQRPLPEPLSPAQLEEVRRRAAPSEIANTVARPSSLA